ncbi:hypothetical protein [Bacillus cereus]|uniref:hypothetical protein n=1 Tax=Bacillus cereus TaxID=1396 RepID=UPI000BF7B782|nr:hypothetical protein [Bacillus cereus]PFO90343.1 hypothetical protein COJ97_28710 [Bacillus cereus]
MGIYGNGSIKPSDYKIGWNENVNGDIIVELENPTYKKKQEGNIFTSAGSKSELTAIKKHKLTIREVTKN